MSAWEERAKAFRGLHEGPHLFVLPNAWDVPSARIFEDAGFPAIATSSAGLMVSLGYPDGETIPPREFFSAIERIASRLHVPLSADLVSGFGRRPSQLRAAVDRVVAAGAVGINVEDVDLARQALYPIETQVERLRVLRRHADARGLPLVINARTDALRFESGDARQKLEKAIERLRAYREAGVDCLYPILLTDGPSIETLVRSVEAPVNVMVRRGLPTIAELDRIGVRRLSFGPAASYATFGLLRRVGREIREEGRFDSLIEGAITLDELNRLAVARPPTNASG